MNPIFQNRAQQPQTPQLNFNADPRQQVLNLAARMNPAQKQKLKAMLPQAKAMANKFGINIDTVATEINNL